LKIWWRVLIARRHLFPKTRHQIFARRHQIPKTRRLFSVRSLSGKRARNGKAMATRHHRRIATIRNAPRKIAKNKSRIAQAIQDLFLVDAPKTDCYIS